MPDFNLPFRDKTKYSCRRTICISEDTEKTLNHLDKVKGVDVPKLLRIAIEECLKNHELDGLPHDDNSEQKVQPE